MAITQWVFDGYTIPVEDSPTSRGGAGEWNTEEKLIEQDPLEANVTILTSTGFRSRRRTIRGLCRKAFRDAMQAKRVAKTVGDLTDDEGRTVTARIVKSTFQTLSTADQANPFYSYVIEFMER